MIVATASVAVIATATWAGGVSMGRTPLSPADAPTQLEPSVPPSPGDVATPQGDGSTSPGSPVSPGLPGLGSIPDRTSDQKRGDRPGAKGHGATGTPGAANSGGTGTAHGTAKAHPHGQPPGQQQDPGRGKGADVSTDRNKSGNGNKYGHGRDEAAAKGETGDAADNAGSRGRETSDGPASRN